MGAVTKRLLPERGALLDSRCGALDAGIATRSTVSRRRGRGGGGGPAGAGTVAA